MNKPCPICQALRGKKPGKGKLCWDCDNNQSLKNAWDSYQIVQNLSQTQWMYRYLFPVLLIATHLFLYFRNGGWSGYKIGAAAGELVAWGMWLFNVFWLWPKQKLKVSDMRERMSVDRDRMLLLKVAGEKRVSGTFTSPAK